MSFSSLVTNAPADFEEYLVSSGAKQLLQSLLEQLAKERPTDVVNFLSTFASEQNQSSPDKMEEDSIAVGEDMGDEIPEFARNRKRRGAVSSEPNGEVLSISMAVEATPKDVDTHRKLNEALSRHILCSHLDDTERQEVFDHMYQVQYGAGDFVIRQGDLFPLKTRSTRFEFSNVS